MIPGSADASGMAEIEGMADCAEVERRLQRYLDRELTPQQAQEVQMHLGRCENCRTRYRFEEKLRRLVRTSGAEPAAPAALRERIHQRVLPPRE